MTFILGGMKSGKSSYAAQLAGEREGLGPVVYLATARAGDEEMSERIRIHRAERPTSWRTCEEPRNPADVFASAAGAQTILLDCITSWLTNLIAPLGDEPNRSEVFQLGEMEVGRLIESILSWERGGGECLVVSNLVETGLVSPWPLGRVFQDLAGLTHQRLAAAAQRVYLMSAGLPLRLK